MQRGRAGCFHSFLHRSDIRYDGAVRTPTWLRSAFSSVCCRGTRTLRIVAGDAGTGREANEWPGADLDEQHIRFVPPSSWTSAERARFRRPRPASTRASNRSAAMSSLAAQQRIRQDASAREPCGRRRDHSIICRKRGERPPRIAYVYRLHGGRCRAATWAGMSSRLSAPAPPTRRALGGGAGAGRRSRVRAGHDETERQGSEDCPAERTPKEARRRTTSWVRLRMRRCAAMFGRCWLQRGRQLRSLRFVGAMLQPVSVGHDHALQTWVWSLRGGEEKRTLATQVPRTPRFFRVSSARRQHPFRRWAAVQISDESTAQTG